MSDYSYDNAITPRSKCCSLWFKEYGPKWKLGKKVWEEYRESSVSRFYRQADLGTMKREKQKKKTHRTPKLNGKTTFCSASASSEVSVADIDLYNLFRFVGRDHIS